MNLPKIRIWIRFLETLVLIDQKVIAINHSLTGMQTSYMVLTYVNKCKKHPILKKNKEKQHDFHGKVVSLPSNNKNRLTNNVYV